MRAPGNGSLRVGLCPPQAAFRGGHLLGRIRYGAGEDAATGAGPPQVCLPLPQLDHGGLEERWSTSQRPAFGHCGEVAFAHDGAVLFGTVQAPATAAVCAQSHAAYRQMLEAIDTAGYANLLRVWACVPRINDEEDGRERYKAFCQGRARAFAQAWGDGFPSRLCASTAVGSEDGTLILHFLASRLPGEHCENPRQVAAWAYPIRYGAGSPAFSRATLAPASLSSLLFISGTASIVGHDSTHRRDLGGQLEETLTNLDVLLRGRGNGGTVHGARPQLLKVYLRDVADLPRVRLALACRFPAVPCLYLRAAICRAELALEIEAVAA
ncbi:MAG TPA: hypothetical protein VMT16_16250, partial [Thermoanaerobaculia bacterium]|nr:hypothetical protein [Thermoanaerobaculia bacterium]